MMEAISPAMKDPALPASALEQTLVDFTVSFLKGDSLGFF
jgi:hypothetical protein